ncbi:MAG: OmpA family protein [Geobacteraceae bacterium]|nr:OmpA family protein [Geobacteraceae bacterium]
MGITRLFIVILSVVYCFSCARTGNMIVLLPDTDGKTGRIAVSNKGGSQSLREPGQATSLKSFESAPSAPFHLTEKQVRSIFSESLDALPLPPIHFTLYFIQGSTTLTPESRKLFDEILPAAVARNSSDVSVVGHTDRVGSREANFALAIDRAQTVSDLLVARGFAPDSLEVTSHGEDNPLVRTPDETPEPRNRRVEVIVR